MNDQCTRCAYRGDMEVCRSATCSVHDSWYAVELWKLLFEGRKLLRYNEDIKVEARNFAELSFDTWARKVDAALDGAQR